METDFFHGLCKLASPFISSIVYERSWFLSLIKFMLCKEKHTVEKS